ncbi:hypothetical protein [Rubrivirga sp. IMCC43871]|uniref:hypothetical protein n=1 Tax=Rubrivirga sp. IMCC43871 TaxID=3391575 RepID=UPI00398FC14C
MRLPLLALALLAGCAEAPEPPAAPEAPASPVAPDAPAAPAAPAAPTADDGLAGTWAHVATAATADGPRDPMDAATIAWTFRPDGTGTYTQQVDALGPEPRTRAFAWTLRGDVIDLGGATYTVVSRDSDEMTWHNDRLGDFYIVARR